MPFEISIKAAALPPPKVEYWPVRDETIRPGDRVKRTNGLAVRADDDSYTAVAICKVKPGMALPVCLRNDAAIVNFVADEPLLVAGATG
jgi:hypothetical protein